MVRKTQLQCSLSILYSNIDQMLILRMVLIWFKAVSGLKVNLGKSELVAVGAAHNMDLLVAVLGCKQGSLPMKYLGLPLGEKFKDKSIWNPILEKMERKLAGWKKLYLSKGGRVTLIKALPLTFLLIFSLYSLFLPLWPIVLLDFSGTFCGVA